MNIVKAPEFSEKVFNFAKSNDCSLFDALIKIIDVNNIEIAIVRKLLTPQLIESIEAELKELNLLKKEKV